MPSPKIIVKNAKGLTQLYNKSIMPTVAFGTWKSPPNEIEKAIETAINTGYRNIDCANDYNNEKEIGNILNKLINEKKLIKREQLFIQIKLWNTNHRVKHIKNDLYQSLKDLQIDYVDSYIIHWPQASPSTGQNSVTCANGAYPDHYSKNTMFPLDDNGYFVSDKESHYLDTWLEMEKLVDKNLVKNIGLSNFNRTQISEILSNCQKHRPAILQCECHPYLQQKDLIDYCNINNIQFQAFSPLGSGTTNLAVNKPPSGVIPLDDPLIKSLAKKYNKTSGQIILKWNLQRNVCIVTKSVTKQHIINNFELFDWEIEKSDMELFDTINYGWRHLLWRETSNHFDYPFKDELPYNYQLEKPPKQSSSGTSA